MIEGLAERYVLLKAQWLFFLQNPTGCEWIEIFQILGVVLAVVWSARTSFFAVRTRRVHAALGRRETVSPRDEQKLEAALERIREGIERLAGRRVAAAMQRRRAVHLDATDGGLLLCNVGFLRPRVLISTGVLRILYVEELAAALAHELAHVARRDNLKRAAAEVACFAAPVLVWWADVLRLAVSPGRFFLFELALGLGAGLAFRTLLMPSLVHWQERRCDEWAAAATGDRLVVASALIKMARSRQAIRIVPHPATAFAFYGEPVTRRIRSLTRRAGGRIILGVDRSGRLPLRTVAASLVVLSALAVQRAEATDLAAHLELRGCRPTLVISR